MPPERVNTALSCVRCVSGWTMTIEPPFSETPRADSFPAAPQCGVMAMHMTSATIDAMPIIGRCSVRAPTCSYYSRWHPVASAPRRLAALRRLRRAVHEPRDQLPEMHDLGHRDRPFARWLAALAAARRDQRRAEAELARLLQTRITLAHRPHLAGETDLAEDDAFRRHWLLGQRRDQRGGDGEVGGRLADAQAAGDVEIDVVGADGEAAARVEHGHDHGEPVAVPADDGTARRPGRRGGDQGLDLDQYRPGSLHPGEDGGAADIVAALGEEESGGVRHLGEPGIGHLEDADLVRRPEAVLDRAQDAKLVAALALEIEHGVDHVLEHARSGDDALLGDVADEDDGEAAPL